MSCKIIPPDLKDSKSYEIFKKELQIWEITTEVPKEKRGAVIAAKLPNDSKLKKDLKDKFFESVDIAVLATEDGLDLVRQFLDKELGEDDLEKQVRTWDEFEDCSRGTKNIDEFMSDFDRAYRKAAAASKVVIPATVRAFMVLKRSNIDKTQRMLIMSKLDQTEEEDMFDNMCRELKLVLGSGPGSKKQHDGSSEAIKVDQSNLPSEEVLFAAGWMRRGGGGGGYRGGRGGGRGNGRGGQAPRGGQSHGGGKYENSREQTKPYDQLKNRKNRPDEKGNPTTCHNCGSKYHYLNKCPDREEAAYFIDDNGEADEPEHMALFTDDRAELSQFTQEALNCAALDTCCTSSVSGNDWMEIYLDSMSESDRTKVRGPLPSDKVFKFGNNGRLKSEGRYIVPATLARKPVTIEIDVVKSDIPLLLSKQAMKKAGMNIDLKDDTVTAFGRKESLITTTCGHYCMSLRGSAETGIEKIVEQILAIDLVNIDDKEQFKAMVKLHRQFGHTPKEKFIDFMKDANSWHKGLEKHLDRIINNCDGCIKKQRNPPKPIVSLPMARTFNEKVAIDLKKWQEKYILHMVDMYSRLTISCFISRKKPCEVIDKIMEKWIGYFGVMKSILNDNGGEFTGQEIKDVKDTLDVIDLTTGAESPWMNGLCEKNHALVDSMLERMIEDYPNTPDHVLLAWANMAKNSMQMVYGYSSNQLVYGTNPNLPNIMTNGLPAMEGKTSSEVFAMHLNSLQAARKAFTESENSERVRKALMRKVCTNNTVFENGDRVWYKRERDGKWKGPAKVIFQDGKVIWVRHGSSAVRVSANRLIKQGEEYVKDRGDETQDVPTVDATRVDIEDESDDIEEERIIDTVPPRVNQEDQEMNVNSNQNYPGEINSNREMVQNRFEPAREDFEQNSEAGNLDESRIITEEGRRKRRAVETSEDENQISKRTRVLNPPSKSAKIALKKDDTVEINIDADEWLGAKVIDRSKVTGKFYNYFNVLGEDGLERNVDLERLSYRKVTEEEVNMVLIPKETHSNEECKKAKVVELRKLEEFDSFDEVDDDGQFRISCTWILWRKGDEVRARLVARGFEEQEEVPSDSPTVDKCNIRILLAIAASKGWTVKCSDVKSAFLQGRQLDRKVTLIPPKEANVPKGRLWQLKVALYGLDDASLQFFFKCKDVLIKLGCTQSIYDPAMFYKHNVAKELTGCIVLHVDDFLHAGENSFENTVSEKLTKVYKMGKVEEKKFRYVGFDIEQKSEGIYIDQSHYAEEKIEVFDVSPDRSKDQEAELTGEEKSMLRKCAGKIGWLARGSRPDLIFSQIEMSTKFINGKVRDLIQASKVMRKVKSSDAFFLIRSLGPVSAWTIEVWTDASLSNLNDGVNSTGATLVLLVNGAGDCAPVVWQANKIKRIVGSTLEAECLALVDGLKESIYVREVIEELFGLKEKTVPVRAVIDNKSTVDAIHSTTSVEDKKLRRDIGMIKQMMNNGEVASVSWCPGKDQLADCMTKRTASSFDLLSVFQTGKRKNL